MTPKKPVKRKKSTNRRTKHDQGAITIQFMTSDHAELLPFLRELGYPETVAKTKWAKDLAREKRRVINTQTERLRQTLLAEPIRAREERKFSVLKELEQAGRALQAAIMNDLIPDLQLTNRRENESVEDWIARLKTEDVANHRLTPGEKMALSVALKNADDLIRKAAGLEDFDWDHAERNAQAMAKASRLEFEIVHTSNARPLDQLPYAPEDTKKEVG